MATLLVNGRFLTVQDALDVQMAIVALVKERTGENVTAAITRTDYELEDGIPQGHRKIFNVTEDEKLKSAMNSAVLN